MPKSKPKTVGVATALVPLAVPIDSIEPWPGNPRQGDVGAIAESIKRFGQQKPVVVQRSSMCIVAGNHLWAAAKALGWETVAANVVEMSDTDAEAFLIADNRTAELGGYDDAALSLLLADLAKKGNLQGTGYDGDDVDAMLLRMEKELAEEVKPEIAFTSELLESSNYVVLHFDNDLDWAAAVDMFDLGTVKTHDSREGYERQGIGRIIDGASVVRRLAE